MNKAQSEIMGLAFVMVIITIGLAILVSFSLRSESTDYVNIFTKSELPLFLNNAMLETNIEECYGEKLSRLLMKCAEDADLICPETIPDITGTTDNALIETSSSNDKDACVVSYRFIKNQLHKVLTENYQYFRYFVYTGDDYEAQQIFTITNSNCERMNIPHPGRLFFRIAGGELLNTKLDICYEQ